jgi:hypothetical protein
LSVGGLVLANEVFGNYNPDTMDGTQGNFFDPDVSAQSPLFAPFHATVDMFLREWTSRCNDYVNTTWGNAFNVFFLDDSTYEGINGNDTIASRWPIYWQDVGWAELGSDEAMRKVTHTQAYSTRKSY